MPRLTSPASAKPAVARQPYFIVDKTAKSIAGQKLQIDQKTIDLHESEASFFLASGAISTQDPAKDDQARKALEKPEGAEVPPADHEAASTEHEQPAA